MTTQQQHLENLSEIRNLMERSSRFISLSGLSGVFAGTTALIGAGIAIWHFDLNIYYPRYSSYLLLPNGAMDLNFLTFLFADAAIVLLLSIGFGVYFTTRKARNKGLSIWDSTAKRLIINLFVPLAAGGLFCMILLYHHDIHLIAPSTLIFYGLALINASKYTLNDIRYLGITEIIIGLIAAAFLGYGLLFWVIGFGLMHIIYGAVMYFKYER